MRRGIVAGLFVLGLVLAPQAHAGDYTVRSCKEESGSPVHPVDGWEPLGSVGVETIGESCFRGGSLWGRLPGGNYKVGTHVGWKFVAPAGTQIVNYRISRSTTVGPASTGNATPEFYVAWPTQGSIREICLRPGCSALGRRDRAVPENIITPSAAMSGVGTLYFVAQCGGTAGSTCLDADSPPGTETVRFDIHAAQITLRDSSAPAVPALTGPLAEPGRTHTGTTTVTARATDAGAGVASFTLEVDGQAVASAVAPGCQAEPYTARTPCPTDISQSLELDTTKLAFGGHSVRVVARDASGNTGTSAPIDVLVDNRRRAAYAATLSYDYRNSRRGTRFTRMSAKRVPGGAAITLSCAGGRKRACPFKSRTVVSGATKANYALLPASLKRRFLRPKARLVVRITAADGSVWRRTLTIRTGKAPKRSTRCREGDARARYEPCG